MSFIEEIEVIVKQHNAKCAIVILNEDGTSECGYFNMNLKDKAQVKHEIEIDIIDAVIRANAERYSEVLK